MKKFIALLCTFILCINNLTYASDMSMCIINGWQDAFVIGKIQSYKSGDYYCVKIEKVLTGKVMNLNLKVKKFEYYGNAEPKIPKINDYCVLSINKVKGIIYKVKYGAFKSDSLNYKKLKLAKSQYYEGVKSIEKYINSENYTKKVHKHQPL
jgi:hypothetical protein